MKVFRYFYSNKLSHSNYRSKSHRKSHSKIATKVRINGVNKSLGKQVYLAVYPPSTGSVMPLIKLASLLARKVATDAISSG